jgi:hypothetical protein
MVTNRDPLARGGTPSLNSQFPVSEDISIEHCRLRTDGRISAKSAAGRRNGGVTALGELEKLGFAFIMSGSLRRKLRPVKNWCLRSPNLNMVLLDNDDGIGEVGRDFLGTPAIALSNMGLLPHPGPTAVELRAAKRGGVSCRNTVGLCNPGGLREHALRARNRARRTP